MIRPQLVRSFTHAALSPEPDLAVAALMIARVEYPKLDAGPYLDQLDAYVFAFIDLQQKRRITPPEFFKELFELLAKEIGDESLAAEEPKVEAAA